jgi:hypothetical protein
MCRNCKRVTETVEYRNTLPGKPICKNCGACKCESCQYQAKVDQTLRYDLESINRNGPAIVAGATHVCVSQGNMCIYCGAMNTTHQDAPGDGAKFNFDHLR